MFCVLNKQKIYSYLIASSMVMILLVASIFLTKENQNTMETWSETNTTTNNITNSVNNTNKVNIVNNVTTNKQNSVR